MPVTAKLSSKFYQRLGDDVANELVALLNTMDSTYLAELRQLNELNYSRFESKLEQRVAELRAEFKTGFVELRAELGTGHATLRAELGTGQAKLATDIEAVRADLMKWMVGFFVPTILSIIGVLVAVLRLR